MAQTDVFMDGVTEIDVQHFLDGGSGAIGPFVWVKWRGENVNTCVNGTSIARAREAARSLDAACDAVEDAIRRANAVPIESLAPSKVALGTP